MTYKVAENAEALLSLARRPPDEGEREVAEHREMRYCSPTCTTVLPSLVQPLQKRVLACRTMSARECPAPAIDFSQVHHLGSFDDTASLPVVCFDGDLERGGQHWN